MIDWIVSNQTILWRLAALGGATALAGTFLIPWLLVRMPVDYFVGKDERPRTGAPVWRTLFRVAKNLLGGMFLLIGMAMLVLPGPGFLVILVGMGMLSFPGKRALMRRLAGSPAVLKPINHLRRRAGVPPLSVG